MLRPARIVRGAKASASMLVPADSSCTEPGGWMEIGIEIVPRAQHRIQEKSRGAYGPCPVILCCQAEHAEAKFGELILAVWQLLV